VRELTVEGKLKNAELETNHLFLTLNSPLEGRLEELDKLSQSSRT
jgi:hypothetical protein